MTVYIDEGKRYEQHAQNKANNTTAVAQQEDYVKEVLTSNTMYILIVNITPEP
jgi:hypothetical protein